MRLSDVGIGEIDWGTRAREDYKDLDSLSRDIKEKGLISPICLYEKPAIGEGEQPFLLLAGGRRLKCVASYLKWDTIPANIYDHVLSELEIKSIELAENIQREGLSYIEEVKLKDEIHALQLAIHGPKVSTSPDAPGHSLRDTAEMLGISHASLSQDLKIAKAMKQFPELQWDKLKNKSDATKLIAKIESSVCRMVAAEEVEKNMGTGDTFKRRMLDSYIVGDFFNLIENIPDGSMNLVEMDPPYAIDLQGKKKGYDYDGYNEVDQEDYIRFLSSCYSSLYKKMSTDSWLVCWFGIEWYATVIDLLQSSGFKTCPIPGIWFKGNEKEGEDIATAVTGQTHMPMTRLGSSYETFIYCQKGNPCLGRPGSFNVLSHKPVPPGKKSHPTERPLSLMLQLYQIFGKEGERVLVPFAGSGVSLIAAAQSKMLPIGFDLTQAYKDSYTIRVNQLW